LKDPVEKSIVVPKNTQIIIVEGNYLLLQDDHWKKARQALDKVYYLQVELEVAKLRLASRHAQVWNWPFDKAMERVIQSDYLNMLTIKETAQYADDYILDAVK
jgi:pantothenate kinase